MVRRGFWFEHAAGGGMKMTVLSDPVNRAPAHHVEFNEGCKCIASECAMWRWKRQPRVPGFERQGYCGLAGVSDS